MIVSPACRTARADLEVDGYWYLATPYSKHPNGITEAFKQASSAAGNLLKRGVHVYCPIAHTHPIALYGGLDPFDHGIFLPFDEKMMHAAHGILVVKMPGYFESAGIAFEVGWFESRRKPVVMLEWPSMDVSS